MIKNTFFIIIVTGISFSFLLTSKEKAKEKIEISSLEIMQGQVDLLIISNRRKGGATR